MIRDLKTVRKQTIQPFVRKAFETEGRAWSKSKKAWHLDESGQRPMRADWTQKSW